MRVPAIHLDAITSAAVTFLLIYVLMTSSRPGAAGRVPARGSRLRTFAWDLVVSAWLCLAASGCLVASAFIETFGVSWLLTALISALRGLSVPGAALFIAASCLNLQKTRWLLGVAAPTRPVRFAIDVIGTGALFLGLQSAGGTLQPWTLVSDMHKAIYFLLFAETGWMWFARSGWLLRKRSNDLAVTLGVSALWAAAAACWATRFSLL